MLKATVRYARYALSALSSVGFGLTGWLADGLGASLVACSVGQAQRRPPPRGSAPERFARWINRGQQAQQGPLLSLQKV